MGVINVTPDSFTGDGLYKDVGGVLRRARDMIAQGADMLDVGGESSRPGHTPVSIDEELSRVIPAIRRLADCVDIPLSVDTSKAIVAREAAQAGASFVNDVSGLRDEGMIEVVRAHHVGLVLVHHGRPPPGTAVIDCVLGGLEHQIHRALAAGIPAGSLMIDPGLGIAKGWQDNLQIMHDLARLQSLGLPVLIGPSRKATISKVLGVAPTDRLEGTLALAAIAAARGATMVRVHDVRAAVAVCRMIHALNEALRGPD